MKRVSLSNSKKSFVVDDVDYIRVIQYNWHLIGNKRITIQARRGIEKINLGRYILNLKDPNLEIDRADRDHLNNCRSNLRIATRSQNNCNKGKVEGTTSKFKGVVWHKQARKWMAQIAMYRNHHYLGLFDSEEKAACAYDEAAKQFHGDFAVLNFPSKD